MLATATQVEIPASAWGILGTVVLSLLSAISFLWLRFDKAISDAKTENTQDKTLLLTKLAECEEKHETAHTEYVKVATELAGVKAKVEMMESVTPAIAELAQGVHRLLDERLHRDDS